MKRVNQPWTPEVKAYFATLVQQGKPNTEIARLLGRSTSNINRYKNKLGLLNKPEYCLYCHEPLNQGGIGRPRKYCQPECCRLADAQRRSDAVAEQARAREGRICEAHACTNPLPTTNPRRRYCSRTCARRTHELAYIRTRKPR